MKTQKPLVATLFLTLGLAIAAACSSPSAPLGTEAAPPLSSTSAPAPTPTAESTPAPVAQPAPEATSAPEVAAFSTLPDDPRELMAASLEMSLAEVVTKMAHSGNKSFIPVLIDWLRFQRYEEGIITIASFLDRLIKEPGAADIVSVEKERVDWGWWVEWLGNHPEVRPPEGYDAWKGQLFSLLDPGMGAFFYEGVKARIRLEEVAWGGVRKDGIPDLTDPPVVSASEAAYLQPSDRVFGVSINGEHRAYPLRILNAHEMANDVVGGVPIVLAY